jgi:hypothetical protein
VQFFRTKNLKNCAKVVTLPSIVFPFIIWFYGSAIAVQLLGAGVVVLAIVNIL